MKGVYEVLYGYDCHRECYHERDQQNGKAEQNCERHVADVQGAHHVQTVDVVPRYPLLSAVMRSTVNYRFFTYCTLSTLFSPLGCRWADLTLNGLVSGQRRGEGDLEKVSRGVQGDMVAFAASRAISVRLWEII